MASIGLEFQPREVEEGFRESLNKSPSTQEALQVLSLRLPKMLGGAPLAPEDTLRAGMQPGRTPTTLVEILKRVLGASPETSEGAGAMPGISGGTPPLGAAMPALPSPSITPSRGGAVPAEPEPPEPPVTQLPGNIPTPPRYPGEPSVSNAAPGGPIFGRKRFGPGY